VIVAHVLMIVVLQEDIAWKIFHHTLTVAAQTSPSCYLPEVVVVAVPSPERQAEDLLK